MRILRLFGESFSIALRRDMAFRANLIFQTATSLISLLAGLAALNIVYSQTATLAGWRLDETIVLLGTYEIVSGLLATFIVPNVEWFAGQVKSGKFDEILLKPVSSLYLATLGTCAPLGLLQVVLGCGVLGYGILAGDRMPTLAGLLSWMVLMGVAIAVTWATRVLVACIALWTPAIELDVVFSALWQFGRYPVHIYQHPVRFLLTYILPVALIATLPARALTRGISPMAAIIAVMIGCLSILVVRGVWYAGLRRYTSATS